MTHRVAVLAVAAAVVLATGARAQVGARGVTESTDPARVEAVEKAARDLKERIARDRRSGTPPAAVSIVRGSTEGGVAFASGGITVDDRLALHAERGAYSLWVATVAKGSGAYLADAKLRIVDRKTKGVVLERVMEGPWLFAALPPGGYEILATLEPEGAGAAQTLSTNVRIGKTGQRQAVLRFVSAAQVAPEMQSPFQGNPFGAPLPGK